MTADYFIQQVWTTLNQPDDSGVAALASGTGAGIVTIDSDDQVLTYLTAAQNDLARNANPILDSLAVSVTSGLTALPAYNTLATSAGRIPFRGDTLYQGSFKLINGRFGDFADWYQTALPDQPIGCPQAWADTGGAIRLSSALGSTLSFALTAWCLPKPLIASDTVVDVFCDDEEIERLITYWACYQVAQKAIDNPSLTQRAGLWRSQYESGRLAVYERTVQADNSLAAWFAPPPPLPPQIGAQQKAVKT